jgi:hypothetical protein
MKTDPAQASSDATIFGPAAREILVEANIAVLATSARHPGHRAQHITVRIAQIREIHRAERQFAHVGRVSDRFAAMRDSVRVPCVDLLARSAMKANRAK